MTETREYETEAGTNPFSKWFLSLGTKAALKVRTAIAQMEAGNLGDHKSVGGGVWERRINFEKGYRVYFAKDGNELIILFYGGTKVRQQSDIDTAKSYWSDYKRRKKQDAKVAKPQKQKKRRK